MDEASGKDRANILRSVSACGAREKFAKIGGIYGNLRRLRVSV